MPLEPVSPELVLVDPELALRERARLEEQARLQSVLEIATLRRAVEAQPLPVDEPVRLGSRWREAVTFSRQRLVPAILLCSILANGLFVAHFVARAGEEATQVAVRMVTVTNSEVTTPATTGAPAAAPATTSVTRSTTPPPTTKGAVERRVVSLILSAPTQKLPRAFIDPTTGLVKNNVQVVCGKKKQRSFLCAVRNSADKTSRALYVRYRMLKKGGGVFKWYGFKRQQKAF